MKTQRLVLQWFLGIALTYALQRWDKGRLLPEQRDRAWNTASWGSALYGFGQLSMLGWAWVTLAEPRRWWRRSPARAIGRGAAVLLAGLRMVVTISLVIGLVDAGVAWLSGAPE
jgi:hypothetical protein